MFCYDCITLFAVGTWQPPRLTPSDGWGGLGTGWGVVVAELMMWDKGSVTLWTFFFFHMTSACCSQIMHGPSDMKVAQSCLTLYKPMDYTVHGILQARILEWVAFHFSRGSSQPRDWTLVSQIAGGFFTTWATREAPKHGPKITSKFKTGELSWWFSG